MQTEFLPWILNLVHKPNLYFLLFFFQPQRKKIRTDGIMLDFCKPQISSLKRTAIQLRSQLRRRSLISLLRQSDARSTGLNDEVLIFKECYFIQSQIQDW